MGRQTPSEPEEPQSAKRNTWISLKTIFIASFKANLAGGQLEIRPQFFRITEKAPSDGATDHEVQEWNLYGLYRGRLSDLLAFFG